MSTRPQDRFPNRGADSPPWPALERKVEGRWVSAYSPGYLSCLIKPDFTLKSGETYHAVFDFMAYESGHNAMPTLDVSSIDGIYRLRWDFAEGTDAIVRGARVVKSTSNEFRMVVPGDAYDGAFINHPDVDMADPAWNTSGIPWHTLYYNENHPRLQRIKARWDPRNVFRHALSIR